MQFKLVLVFGMALLASGCSTFTTPRYSISADTNVTLRSLNATNVGVGAFTGPAAFDNACRGAGPLSPVDGISHTEYIRRALESELKVAGSYATSSPRVVLSAVVNRMEFSSSRGITGGSWTIDLTVSSSNGKWLTASEQYLFESGFIADTACKQTAEAFLPAVQNLIAKVVQNPSFNALLQ